MKIETKKINDKVNLYTISNGKMYFSVMNYGCTITEIVVPNKNGEETDVVLGCDDFGDFEKCGDSRGAIVGRVANRIKGASFNLNGKTFELDKNDGENCLHSGKNRFEKMIWDAELIETEKKSGIRFSRISKAMEQGFPGNVEIVVEYTLDDENNLRLEYSAKTDEATPINLTNHAYFNLNGVESDNGKILDVLNHKIQLDCEKVLEIGGDTIPTGKILNVENTIFDFRNEKTVGKDIALCDKRIGSGFDNCFVTKADEKDVVRVGSVFSEESGIKMEIFTNQRGVQIYSGNYLEGSAGKCGISHKKYDGICFETQRFPNAVNLDSFPSSILNPNEEYKSITIYKF